MELSSQNGSKVTSLSATQFPMTRWWCRLNFRTFKSDGDFLPRDLAAIINCNLKHFTFKQVLSGRVFFYHFEKRLFWNFFPTKEHFSFDRPKKNRQQIGRKSSKLFFFKKANHCEFCFCFFQPIFLKGLENRLNFFCSNNKNTKSCSFKSDSFQNSFLLSAMKIMFSRSNFANNGKLLEMISIALSCGDHFL